MKEIYTDINIASSPEKIWKTLIDFEKYPQWNPFIQRIDGEPKIGSKIKIHIHTSSGKSRTYKPTVTRIEPNHELRWFGKSIIPGIFNGERIFTIELIESNKVHFIHKEIFTGLIVSLVGDRMDKDMYQSFMIMNNALKERAEQG